MKTVLMTGATGVVGSALVEELRGQDLVCVAHRRAGDPSNADWVKGDLTRPRLGLSDATFRALTRRTDAVVHCAAVTNFAATRAEMDALNVRGTDAIIEFAAAADAPLYYVSTAFVARRPRSAATGPAAYLDTKREAEARVRGSGLPATVIRPSVVIGDSVTGRIEQFQGLHSLAAAYLRHALPMIPLAPHCRIDFVPQDVAAACIGDLVRHDVTGGEWWLTGGREAPTVARLVECTEAVAGEYGRRPARPRLMEPEAVDRLIRPLLEETLSPVACRRFDELLETTSLFDGVESFPSSLAALGRPLCASQLEQSWASSVRYWADRKRLAPDRRARAAS